MRSEATKKRLTLERFSNSIQRRNEGKKQKPTTIENVPRKNIELVFSFVCLVSRPTLDSTSFWGSKKKWTRSLRQRSNFRWFYLFQFAPVFVNIFRSRVTRDKVWIASEGPCIYINILTLALPTGYTNEKYDGVSMKKYAKANKNNKDKNETVSRVGWSFQMNPAIIIRVSSKEREEKSEKQQNIRKKRILLFSCSSSRKFRSAQDRREP